MKKIVVFLMVWMLVLSPHDVVQAARVSSFALADAQVESALADTCDVKRSIAYTMTFHVTADGKPSPRAKRMTTDAHLVLDQKVVNRSGIRSDATLHLDTASVNGEDVFGGVRIRIRSSEGKMFLMLKDVPESVQEFLGEDVDLHDLIGKWIEMPETKEAQRVFDEPSSDDCAQANPFRVIGVDPAGVVGADRVNWYRVSIKPAYLNAIRPMIEASLRRRAQLQSGTKRLQDERLIRSQATRLTAEFRRMLTQMSARVGLRTRDVSLARLEVGFSGTTTASSVGSWKYRIEVGMNMKEIAPVVINTPKDAYPSDVVESILRGASVQ